MSVGVLCIMIKESLLEVVNTVRSNKGVPALSALHPAMRLREDLGFDSLDLAELTARIDHRFHVDVFAEGIVTRVGELQRLIDRRRD